MIFNKILVFNMMLLMKPKLVSQAVVSSLVAMEPLAETQGYVVRSVQEYVTKAEKEIDFIENHIYHSVNTLGKIRENPEYISNPINAYSFINRVRRQFDFIRNFTRRRIGYYKDPSLIYPSLEDLYGAALGIVRLQMTYRMNVTDLADGRLVSNFSGTNNLYIEQVRAMSASDRYFLGTMPRALQGSSGQLQWMLAALRRHRAAPERFDPVNEERIIYKISEAYYHLNEYNRSLVWWNKLRALLPVHEKKKMDPFKLELQEYIAQGAGHKTRKQQKRAWRQPRNIYDLCYKDLKCRNGVVSKPHLLWCERAWTTAMRTYAPTRIEWLQLVPRIAMFYDVISDREIEDVKTLAIPNMKPSKVNILMNNTVTTNVNSGNRLSMEAILEAGSAGPGVATRLTRRLRDVTGFRMRAPERRRLLVVNYGVAGAYSAHGDSHKLSDVEQGGALVFPSLGVKVYPRKGAAVSWIAEDEHAAKVLMHVACPVIRGSKWS